MRGKRHPLSYSQRTTVRTATKPGNTKFPETRLTEYNTDTDPKAAAARKEIDDGDDVPFAVIGRSHVYGFSEAVYQRALKQSR